MTIKVYETFPSVQGEGFFQGTPMNFIRLAGCNLSCLGCDTADAQDKHAGLDLEVDEIIPTLDLSLTWVCITGGEPLLQRDELHELLYKLRERHKRILVETNGTIGVRSIENMADWLCVSPKMDDLDFVPAIPYADEVKIPVGHPAISGREEHMITYILKSVRPIPVISLQPWAVEGNCPEPAIVRQVLSMARQWNVNVSMQLHKLIKVVHDVEVR